MATIATLGTVACVSQPQEAELHAEALSRGPGSGPLARVAVEAQPLGANIERLLDALDYLGAPVAPALRRDLIAAAQARDADRLQQLLDDRVLLVVHINPETRVKVARGPAAAVLQQAGYTPAIVKILNESRGTPRLRIGSPQAGPVYAGMTRLAGERMQQQQLRENENVEGRGDRFLDLEMFTSPPMTPMLSGLDVEYALALIYSSEAGRREATITFDVGQGTQDLGFRAEAPVLFTVKPADPGEAAGCATWTEPRRWRGCSSSMTRATCIRRSRSGWRRICSFRNRSTARTAKRCCCLRESSRCHYGRGPEYRVLQRTVDRARGRDRQRQRRRCSARSICGSSAGSIRRLTVSTAAITTSTPRAAPTTPLRRRAWTRPTCSARSREKGSTSAAC